MFDCQLHFSFELCVIPMAAVVLVVDFFCGAFFSRPAFISDVYRSTEVFSDNEIGIAADTDTKAANSKPGSAVVNIVRIKNCKKAHLYLLARYDTTSLFFFCHCHDCSA